MEFRAPNSTYRPRLVRPGASRCVNRVGSRSDRSLSGAIDDRHRVRRSLRWLARDYRALQWSLSLPRPAVTATTCFEQTERSMRTAPPATGRSNAKSLPVGITATGIALDATTGGYWVLSSNGAVTAIQRALLR